MYVNPINDQTSVTKDGFFLWRVSLQSSSLFTQLNIILKAVLSGINHTFNRPIAYR